MAWLGTWKYRFEITIDNTNVDSDLSHFPVPIILGTSVGQSSQDLSAIFDELGAESLKLAVTQSDGETQLYVEVEQWDSGNEKAVLWVSSSGWSVTSASTTTIYLYFDSSQSDNSAYVGVVGSTPGQSVWDSNYVGVWHLSEDPTGGAGCIKDSTSSANHGTPAGSMTAGDRVSGQVGDCLEFDGTNDYIGFGSQAEHDLTGDLTIEALFATSASHAGGAGFLLGRRGGSLYVWYDLRVEIDNALYTNVNDSSNNRVAADSATTRNDGNWHYAAAAWGAPDLSLWTDSAEDATDSNASTGALTYGSEAGELLTIGANTSGYNNATRGYFFEGKIEEVRLSNTARNDAWRKATYYALFDNLLTYGVREHYGWLDDWAYRKQITVDSTNIDSVLTHFPIPIFLSSSCGQSSVDATDIFDELSSSSLKIAVTKDDGKTQLYVEVEQWDDTAEEAVLWVSSSGLELASGADTTLYLYFDSAQSDNSSYVGVVGSTPGQAVWDSNYVGVWHLSEDPSGTAPQMKDSTSNGNDGTSNGTMTSGDLVAGQVGDGLDFDGSDDYIGCGDIDVHNNNSYTVEVIVDGAAQSDKRFFSESSSVDADPFFGIGTTNNSPYQKARVYIRDDDGTERLDAESIDTIADGSPHYLAWKDNNSTYTFRIDEAASGTGSYTKNTKATNQTDIARHGIGGGGSYFAGIIDEVRLSTVARSDAWLKATYYALFDDFITLGATEGAWLDDWAKRIKITLSSTNVDSDLTDFPVMLKLGTSVGTGFDDISAIFDELTSDANRTKIAVTTDDGTTQCYVEIEKWDDANEVAWLHVKVPTVYSARDTILYVYYDSSQSANTTYVGDVASTPGQNVWDSNFVGVWHLSEDPTGGAGCLKDSTASANNGQGYNMESGDQTDHGLDFDGSNEYAQITYGSEMSASAGQFSTECLFTPAAGYGTYDSLFTKDFGGGSQYGTRVNGSSSSQVDFGISGNTKSLWIAGVGSISSGNPVYAAAALDTSGNTGRYRVNGATGSSIPSNVSRSEGGGDLYIARDNRDYYYYPGHVTELRLSDAARSAAWLKATYYTLFDDLASYGAEETMPTSSTAFLLVVPDVAVGASMDALVLSINWTLAGLDVTVAVDVEALTVAVVWELVVADVAAGVEVANPLLVFLTHKLVRARFEVGGRPECRFVEGQPEVGWVPKRPTIHFDVGD